MNSKNVQFSREVTQLHAPLDLQVVHMYKSFLLVKMLRQFGDNIENDNADIDCHYAAIAGQTRSGWRSTDKAGHVIASRAMTTRTVAIHSTKTTSPPVSAATTNTNAR